MSLLHYLKRTLSNRLSEQAKKRIRKYITIFIVSYMILLLLSYILLEHEESVCEYAVVNANSTASVVEDIEESKSLQKYVKLVRKRKTPKFDEKNTCTRSIFIWDVIGRWLYLRRYTNELQISTMDDLDWISSVLEKESQANENKVY